MSRMLVFVTFLVFLVCKKSLGAGYNEFCGGFAGITCDEGYSCVYNSVDCDPDCGGSDCGGICLREDPNTSNGFCGGFAGFQCSSLSTCYDTKGDQCSSNCGGSDCGGQCYFNRDVAIGDSCEGCTKSAAPCSLCDDGVTQYGACGDCVLGDDYTCQAEIISDSVCLTEGDSCNLCFAPLCACQLCDDNVTEVGCCGDCRINSEKECVYHETSSSQCPTTVQPGDSCDLCIQPLCMCTLCDDGVTQTGCCGTCVINDELQCVYEETGTQCPVVDECDISSDKDCNLNNDQESCELCESLGCIWYSDYSTCGVPVFCTQEAKLCSDGVTYVGRTGPNCEFADCPDDDNDNDNNDCDSQLDTCLSECPSTTESAEGEDTGEGGEGGEGYEGGKGEYGGGNRRRSRRLRKGKGDYDENNYSCRGSCNRQYRECSSSEEDNDDEDDDDVDCEMFCTLDAKLCDDGSYVSRDPCNGCQFEECDGEDDSDTTDDEDEDDDSSDEDCDNACTEEAKICDDGSSVSRDPCNDCEFEECPDDNDNNSNGARNEESSAVYAGDSKILSWFVVPLAILIGVLLLIGGGYLLYKKNKKNQQLKTMDGVVQESTPPKHVRLPSGSINGGLMNTSGGTDTTTTNGETNLSTV